MNNVTQFFNKPLRRQLSIALMVALPLAPMTTYGKTNATLPLDEIRNFVDVYNAIKNEYVEEKDGKTLIDFAIKGMLDGLDPHSVYFKKSQLENFQDSTSGSYVGFGFKLEIVKGRLLIISPIPGSPAEKAGLKPNDHIVKINKTIVDDMSMQAVSDMLKENPTVTLTIATPGKKTREVTLTRSTVNLPSITAKQLEKNYGYIRIAQFQDNTGAQFNHALRQQIKHNVKGLIIDLRNNPGGLVHSATAIADSFLDAGLIVSTKNPNTGSEDKVHAGKEATINKELPLVVLINEGSASASELLAGALQSHKRAIIVGQPSFGKGSVQNVIPLSNGDAIKLTTARYYTPDGQSIQAKGITPDITLSQLTVDDKELDLLSYSEADIAGHLDDEKTSNDESSEDSKQSNKKDRKGKKDNKPHSADNVSSDKATDGKSDDALSGNALAKSDLQLFEALNVLKVLTLTRQ